MKTGSIYSVGIASGDITPPVGAPLAGFADRGFHASTGVYHPLRTVAISIGDDQTECILVSAELLFFAEIADRVRRSIHEQTGIEPSRIILCGTHTHCGPGMRKIDKERHGGRLDDYWNQTVATISAAVVDARHNRQPATLSFGVGYCDFAVNRRRPDPDNPGRILFGPAPGEPCDHDVPVLAIKSESGDLRCVLFCYACHPTSRGGLDIGGDYPGFACERIQSAFNPVEPCFLQGCGADQKPGPENPQETVFSQRSIEAVRVLGNRLGDAVIQVLQEDGLTPVDGPLTMIQTVVELETEALDREKITSELRKAEAGEPVSFVTEWAQYHQLRIQAGLPEIRTVPLEIQTLSMGASLAMIFLGAEAVVDYALRIKQDFGGRYAYLMPLAYANDVIGYLPVKRQVPEGGYEVIDNYLWLKRTGRFTVDTEERVMEAITRLLS